MRFVKKIILTLCVVCCVTSIYADKKSMFNQLTLPKMAAWEFKSLDDGLFFLLGPESNKILEINVSPSVNGKLTDTITVHCNGSTYHLKSGLSLVCRGNFNDVASMYIAPDDFKNGSKGIYVYKPVQN